MNLKVCESCLINLKKIGTECENYLTHLLRKEGSHLILQSLICALTKKDIDAQREKRAKEKAAAKEREARDAEMDRQMREGREKAKKKPLYKKGGAVKSSASRRADGIAKKGKTRGKMV